MHDFFHQLYIQAITVKQGQCASPTVTAAKKDRPFWRKTEAEWERLRGFGEN